ncbi:MAG TPA: DUF4139 domain-containing protein [Alphaproteobacteria bacterium]|jgi:hypothetical protein|nr:DUF4139 domain-containing protein [Alphaproteobacteria bacterium]
MTRTTLAPVLLAALLAAGTADAEERPVTLENQTGVAVTIYNGDLALVKDQRTVKLDQGRNTLGFIDVSGHMRPETALLRGGDGVELKLIEQNFNFDLLTPEKLLEKSVGQSVRIARVNPATGQETILDAKVLSAAQGVVLQIGDRVETGIPGRLIFSGVPANLRARPTLVVDLDSSKAVGAAPVELSYLTGGLTWRADYVAELNAKEDRLDLNGWVTLTNTSGTTYKDARMQLVAGDVNRVRDYLAKGAAGATMARAAPAPEMREETFFDYHLYTLGRPTTIADNQTKQVALLSASGVAATKEYRLSGGGYVYQQRIAPIAKPKVAVILEFSNDEKAGIGLPLPAGIVRVYKRDASGQAQFVGEDRIDHTPKGEKVRLGVGSAFDVTAERKQTEFARLGERAFETAHEITLKNARTEPVTVIVSETIPGDWQMVQESAKHTKVTSSEAEWRIAVPAGGSAKLTYKTRVTL